jgi:hypothetical protein
MSMPGLHESISDEQDNCSCSHVDSSMGPGNLNAAHRMRISAAQRMNYPHGRVSRCRCAAAGGFTLSPVSSGTAIDIEPMSIWIDEDLLSDLRSRIRATGWPENAPGQAWRQGTDLAYLQGLLDFWAGPFDWRAQERRLSELHHFRADIDGSRVTSCTNCARRPGGYPVDPDAWLSPAVLPPMAFNAAVDRAGSDRARDRGAVFLLGSVTQRPSMSAVGLGRA